MRNILEYYISLTSFQKRLKYLNNELVDLAD